MLLLSKKLGFERMGRLGLVVQFIARARRQMGSRFDAWCSGSPRVAARGPR